MAPQRLPAQHPEAPEERPDFVFPTNIGCVYNCLLLNLQLPGTLFVVMTLDLCLHAIRFTFACLCLLLLSFAISRALPSVLSLIVCDFNPLGST